LLSLATARANRNTLQVNIIITITYAINVADEPVNGEPVSGSKFPASREFAGNFTKIWPFGICPSERSKISLLEDNSLETGTGNLLGRAGNLQRLAENSPPGAEIPWAGHYR
jgi:hypothetical protein